MNATAFVKINNIAFCMHDMQTRDKNTAQNSEVVKLSRVVSNARITVHELHSYQGKPIKLTFPVGPTSEIIVGICACTSNLEL